MTVRTGIAALLVAGALPLAACNSGSAPTPAASPSPTAASTGTPADYGQRVRDLPAGQRAGVFLRAIRDGGENCQEITESYEIAAIDGNPAWAVTCDRTDRWIIAFTGEGNATVTKASTASRLPPREG